MLIVVDCFYFNVLFFLNAISEINECNSNPCVNGQCSDRLNDYQCTCNRGYHGKQCNKSKFNMTSFITSSNFDDVKAVKELLRQQRYICFNA